MFLGPWETRRSGASTRRRCLLRSRWKTGSWSVRRAATSREPGSRLAGPVLRHALGPAYDGEEPDETGSKAQDGEHHRAPWLWQGKVRGRSGTDAAPGCDYVPIQYAVRCEALLRSCRCEV